MTNGNNEMDVKLYEDGSMSPIGGTYVKGIANHSLGFAGGSGGMVVKLLSGQKVWLRTDGVYPYLHSHYTTFTGFRIGKNIHIIT